MAKSDSKSASGGGLKAGPRAGTKRSAPVKGAAKKAADVKRPAASKVTVTAKSDVDKPAMTKKKRNQGCT